MDILEQDLIKFQAKPAFDTKLSLGNSLFFFAEAYQMMRCFSNSQQTQSHTQFRLSKGPAIYRDNTPQPFFIALNNI